MNGHTPLEVVSPYTGAVIGTVARSGAAEVEQALTESFAIFRNRDRWLPVHQRVDVLTRLAGLMEDRLEELARLAASEGGKPLIDSRVEAARAADGVRLAVETIRSEAGHTIPIAGTAAGAKRLAFTQKEPVGVVVAVSAFNHPLNLIVHQVAAAVAAGCSVIVKPAEDTPLSAFRFVELMAQAGLPEGWCRFLIPTDLELAEALVTDSRVGFFSFIGSAKIGWMLRSRLAPGTRCALEHGGAAPLIVAGDADLDLAVPAILKGGFYHAGQVCVSVQRVFAHHSIAEELANRLAAGASELTVGDPLDERTDVGPLIRPAELERVSIWVDDATQAGARRVSGGEDLGHNCYAPTVLVDPPADARVSREEIFGPVVCVYPFDDLDHAIERANDLPVAFQAAVFTRSVDTALRVYRRIDASAVMVNDHTAFRVDGMPFAGLRQSGYGVGGIPYTIEDMQIEKMAVIHSPEL
ncbi:aldehyde dehydrogenase family protein [Elongatibacter sediminis]|uniref:Aldehyde dehydrogenase family protein n=1 Tax=Elongatibacter sediminis TaxID=3119006 RepID=A0AAW9RAT1_9GAMM